MIRVPRRLGLRGACAPPCAWPARFRFRRPRSCWGGPLALRRLPPILDLGPLESKVTFVTCLSCTFCAPAPGEHLLPGIPRGRPYLAPVCPSAARGAPVRSAPPPPCSRATQRPPNPAPMTPSLYRERVEHVCVSAQSYVCGDSNCRTYVWCVFPTHTPPPPPPRGQ